MEMGGGRLYVNPHGNSNISSVCHVGGGNWFIQEYPSYEASPPAKVGFNSIVWSHRLGDKGIELPPYASPCTKVCLTSIG